MIFCANCGKQQEDGTAFCKNCGNPLTDASGAARTSGQSAYYQQASYAQQSGYSQQYQGQSPYAAIPPEYKPLGAWAYFGYNLLFCIPLVGFILLIVFACGGAKNINLRNYARSFFCMTILVVVIALILAVSGAFLGSMYY